MCVVHVHVHVYLPECMHVYTEGARITQKGSTMHKLL